MKGNRTLIILLVVVLIITVGAVVIGITLSSQPTLPPTNPPTAVIPPTPLPTTPVTPPTTTPTVPTGGETVSGDITNICGGPNNPNGIGTSSGTCGRCVNTGGASSYCQPQAGEMLVIIACSGKTGIECAGAQQGELIAQNVTDKKLISDYITEGCTIQLDVFTTGSDITKTTGLKDFVVFQKDECGSTTPTPTPTPTPNPTTPAVKCGDTCTTNNQCPQDGKHICGSTGKCVLTQCESTPGGCSADKCTVTSAAPICGDTCSANSDCPTGNVCSTSGKCVLDQCDKNPASCQADLCRTNTTTSQCGGTCSADSDCPTDHKCGTDNKCVADACTTAGATNCTNGCVNTATQKCGETCSATQACTSGNTCTNGKCVADFCKDGKCDDGCKLPSTALISDEADRLLILGAVVVMLGLVVLRSNIHVELFYALGGRYLTAEFSDSERELLAVEIEKSRQEQKRKQLAKTKASRQDFEKSVLKD